jgi:hypothetical protein
MGMNDKALIISKLQEEFNRWEELLYGLSEEQIKASFFDGGRSVKDIIAHLTAWQQVSVARLEAALTGKEPVLPDWLRGLDPDSDDIRDKYNEWIYELHHSKSWPDIHREWAARFHHLLELAEAIPENDLLEVGQYPWLKEYPLSAVLLGTYDHHHEHFEPLLVWLLQFGNETASE